MSYTRISQGSYSGDSGCEVFTEYAVIDQNTSGNYSTVRLQVVGRNNSSGYGSWNGGDGSCYARLDVNGVTQVLNSNASFNYQSVGAQDTFITKDVVIQHDSNGNGSFTVYGIHHTEQSIGEAYCSGTVNLPKISQASDDVKFLSGVGPFSDDDSPAQKIYFSKPSGITCNLLLHVSDKTFARGSISSPYSFTLTSSEKAQIQEICKNSKSTPAQFALAGYSGSTLKSADYRDITITIANCAPDAPVVTFVDTNSDTIALTGDSYKFIPGYSVVKATVATKAVAKKSATIKKYKFVCGDDSTTIAESTSEVYKDYDGSNASLTVTATDSRGYTAAASVAGAIINYSPVLLKTLSLVRGDGGLGAAVTLSYTAYLWSGSFGAVSNAVQSLSYRYRVKGETDWTAGSVVLAQTLSGTDLTGTTAIGSFDADKSYEFELTLTDQLTTTTIVADLGPGRPAMKFTGDGKVVFRSDGLYVEDSDGNRMNLALFYNPVGTIKITETNVNPGTYLGGTWELDSQGRMILGASDNYPAGSTGGEETHTLTKNEMPAHSHRPSKTSGFFHCYIGSSGSDGFQSGSSGKSYANTEEVGGGGAHNNMSPYKSYYIWKRTS